MRVLLWMSAKAFVLALILTPIIRDIFRAYEVVDRPGNRKVHAHPIPRMGGIAIAIAYGVSLFTTAEAGPLMSSAAWKLVPAAALVFLTGLLDDLFSLKPIVKLAGVVTAAVVVFYSGIRIGVLAAHPIGIWLDLPLTIFWLLLTTNALNLIDGLDGLCAGMGLLATLTLFSAAILHNNLPLAYATLPLVGALAAFLCYNINPATVFLGDSGALLIGFLLGCYGMIWTQKASTLLSMLVPLLALSIPLLDVSLAVIRRFLRSQPIFSADRQHIHHRLLDRGLSARKAVWVLYLFAALAAAFALLSSSFGGKYQGFVILIFCAAAWIGIRQLGYAEFAIAGGMLFRGGWKRAMDARLKLENLTAKLECASSEQEWWDQITAIGPDLGLLHVRWIGAQRTLEKSFGDDPLHWSFRVRVTETDALEVTGGFSGGSPSFDLLGFAELVIRTYPATASTRPAVRLAVAAS
jgi:UDP-GlcNAc:undecaprenyl-phosphate GlcNAc-1-phosphate transferase